nr:RNA-directed DNA polymerase, eukaryota, reverse transcriptase zinc-binding domain protein [Tanacetum cinerariifolium]
MDTVPPRLADVLVYLIPISEGSIVESVISRIVLAASTYFIWEINGRLFTNKFWSSALLCEVIMSIMRLKLVFPFDFGRFLNEAISYGSYDDCYVAARLARASSCLFGYGVSTSKILFDIDSKTRKHLTVHVHFAPDPKRVRLRFLNLESFTLKSYSHGHYTPEECSIPVTLWILEIAKFERLKSLSTRNMVASAFDLQLLAAT